MHIFFLKKGRDFSVEKLPRRKATEFQSHVAWRLDKKGGSFTEGERWKGW